MRGLQTIQCKQVPGLVPQHHHLLWRIAKAHAQATVDTSCNIVQPIHHHPHLLLAPKHIYSLTLRSRRVSVAGREDDGIMSCLSQSRSSTAGLWQSHLLLESQASCDVRTASAVWVELLRRQACVNRVHGPLLLRCPVCGMCCPASTDIHLAPDMKSVRSMRHDYVTEVFYF